VSYSHSQTLDTGYGAGIGEVVARIITALHRQGVSQ
jgi:hypothetical protein